MKILYKSLALAAIAATTLISCNKEPQPVEQPGPKTGATVIEFNAQVADPGTKATLTPNEGETEFTAAWEGNDELRLIVSNSSDTEETTATWDATKSVFSATFQNLSGQNTWTYKAIWPVPGKNGIEFGSARTQNGNAYNSVYDVMSGSKTVTAEIGMEANNETPLVVTMNRLTGIAYFHITGGPEGENVVSAKLEATGIAAETVSVDASGELVVPETKLDEINLRVNGDLPADDFALWFNVLPGTYSGLTLSITTDGGKTATLSAGSITYTAGKLNKAVLDNLHWSENVKTYTKVTSEPSDWTGTYLIVFEGATVNNAAVPPVAFNGSIDDLTAANNGTAVTISDNTITGNGTINAAVFKISAVTGGYSIQAVGNTKYIGNASDSNGITASETALVNTLSINEDKSVNIVSAGGAYLRYNANSDQRRFRYYKSTSYGGQKPVYLYLLEGSGIPDDRTEVTLSFDPAVPSAISLGDSFTEPTLNVIPSAASSAVTFSVTADPANCASIDSSTGELTINAAGTVTVTASIPADNTTYKPASVSYTLRIESCVSLDWTYPTSGNATVSGLNEVAGVKTFGLGVYADGNAPYLIRMDDDNDYILVKTDSAVGEVSVSYKMIGGASTSTLNILESIDGEEFTLVEDLKIAGSQNDEGVVTTVNSFNSSARYVKINFIKGSNIGIGGISIKKLDTTPRFTVDSPISASIDEDTYTVNITRKYFTGAITVTVPQDCDWIEADNVAANANSFDILVAANTGAARSATLTLSATGVSEQTLVVNQEGNEPGTEANPYSVTEALEVAEALDNNATTENDVYVSGVVSTVEKYFSSYKSITYYISANGTSTGQLMVYSGKGLNGANFSDIADLAIGDQVVVKGKLKKYNSTLEFDQSSRIVSFTPTTRYTVTLGTVTNGSIAASATSVGAQSIVSLTVSPFTGYELDAWTVTNASTSAAIEVDTDGKFTMPAADVNVTATFKVKTSTGGTAEFLPESFSGQGTSSTGSAISATVDGITFASNKGYGTTQIRCYSGSNITISAESGKTITAISFTFSGSYTGGLETSYTNLSTTSWEKSLSSQARITKVTVTYK